MFKTECRTCHKSVALNAKFCPNCGDQNPTGLSAKEWAALIVMGLIILAGVTLYHSI